MCCEHYLKHLGQMSGYVRSRIYEHAETPVYQIKPEKALISTMLILFSTNGQ